MNQAKTLAPIGLVILAIVIYAATFVVKEWEIAIKLRLGEIVDSDYEAGLHFMIPVLNNIKKFDGRIQTLDASPQRFLTVEKKDVIVDSYAKYRIANAAQFYRSTGGDIDRTARLLSERINTSLRNEFGKRTIQEVVSEDRLELMQELTKAVDGQAAELGIEVVDVRVKKIDLPPEVSESVYERMRAERERVARDLRAKGGEAAERIRADADRQRTVILADAYKESEELRGEGDAKAAEIYAGAYTQNKDFYGFYRSLNAYRSAFSQSGNMMVLQPESEFFRYFKEKAAPGWVPDTPPPAQPTARMDAAAAAPDADQQQVPGETAAPAPGVEQQQAPTAPDPVAPSVDQQQAPMESAPVVPGMDQQPVPPESMPVVPNAGQQAPAGAVN